MEQEKDVILMKKCIEDAKIIVVEKRLLESQSAVIQIATTLFEYRKKNM